MQIDMSYAMDSRGTNYNRQSMIPTVAPIPRIKAYRKTSTDLHKPLFKGTIENNEYNQGWDNRNNNHVSTFDPLPRLYRVLGRDSVYIIYMRFCP